MSAVVMHDVVSVDGYIADGHDDVGPLSEWYFNGAVELATAARSRCRPHRPATSGRCGTVSGRW